MTTEKALKFLSNHQPLPDDEYLSEELINCYDLVRKFFIQNPDIRCVPLFLKSFGKGDGFGVYQLIEDVLRCYEKKEILPYIKEGLTHSVSSIRYWNTEIAANFPDSSLIPLLNNLLHDSNRDIQDAAEIALSQIE